MAAVTDKSQPVHIDPKTWATLEKLLKQLPQRVADKVVRRSTRRAAAYLRKKIRAATPIRQRAGLIARSTAAKRQGKAFYNRPPGTGRRNIALKQRRSGVPRGTFRFEVGPNQNAFYLKFLELGTKHIAPRHFMRNTFAAEKDRIIKQIQKDLREGIELEARRLGAGRR